MVTILSAGIKHGYSGHDHLINGSECHDVIGREFSSANAALIAASRAAAKVCDRRVEVAPVEVELRFARGDTRWVSECRTTR